MELIEMLAVVVGGALLGFGVVAMYVWFLYCKLKSQIDQMVNEVLKEAETSMIGLDIEIDQGTYFCYNSEDKQFICQGTTVEEIKQAFQSRYPDKTAYLAGGTAETMEYFKNELLKLKTNENSTGQ
jgi:hypothetical protein